MYFKPFPNFINDIKYLEVAFPLPEHCCSLARHQGAKVREAVEQPFKYHPQYMRPSVSRDF